MKKLLNQIENDYIIKHYSDNEHRRIIKDIFKTTQNLNQAIKIFDNKNYCILDGIITIGK
jgi:hypothetical protein